MAKKPTDPLFINSNNVPSTKKVWAHTQPTQDQNASAGSTVNNIDGYKDGVDTLADVGTKVTMGNLAKNFEKMGSDKFESNKKALQDAIKKIQNTKQQIFDNNNDQNLDETLSSGPAN